MNILIKLMSIVSLVLAPTLAAVHKDSADAAKVKHEKIVEVKYTQDNSVTVASDSTTVNVEVKNAAGEDMLKGLIDGLKADKLVEAETNNIEWKNGVFTINGKAQSAETVKKYAAYLVEGKSFNLSINVKEGK